MNGEPLGPDPIIDSTRLGLMAVLAAVQEIQSPAARDATMLSDAVLSEHAAALEAAGYLSRRPDIIKRKPSTWLGLTPLGRQALRDHIAALRQMLEQAT